MAKQMEESSQDPSSRPRPTCRHLIYAMGLSMILLLIAYLIAVAGLFRPAFFQGLYAGMILTASEITDATRQRHSPKYFHFFMALVVWLAISEKLGLIPATPDSDVWTYLGEPITRFVANFDFVSSMQNGKVFVVFLGASVILFMAFRKIPIPTSSGNPLTRLTDEEPPTTTPSHPAFKMAMLVANLGYFMAGFVTNPAFSQGFIKGFCVVYAAQIATGNIPKIFVVSEPLVVWLAISELIGLIPVIPDMDAYLQAAGLLSSNSWNSFIFLIGVAVILRLFRKGPTPTRENSDTPSTRRADTEGGVQETAETLDDIVVIRSV